jgi:hypothetical protein
MRTRRPPIAGELPAADVAARPIPRVASRSDASASQRRKRDRWRAPVSELSALTATMLHGWNAPTFVDTSQCPWFGGAAFLDSGGRCLKEIADDLGGVARRRGAPRVPEMCPFCVRVFDAQTTRQCLFAGHLLEAL